MGIYYTIGKTTIGAYLRCIYKVKVTGQENIPEDGAVILCCNHISYIDPMILAISIKRPVHFLGKKELFKNKFFSFILHKINVIPVNRSASDMDAYKKTLKVLKDGKLIGIFAQGTRMKALEAKDAKSGVSFFAMKSGAAVVPVYITASYNKFSNVYINIGKPVCLDEFKSDGKKVKSDTLGLITDKIMNEISSLQIIGGDSGWK